MISPELQARMTKRLPELMKEVWLAVVWLDAMNLPANVNERIDTIGEAATELAMMLRDVVNEVQAS